jgi:hypothetical protein
MFLCFSACLQAQGEHLQFLLGINKFVSELILFSYTAFAVALFAEREPELSGTQQHTRQSEYKILTL